jgi:hypothetical protein
VLSHSKANPEYSKSKQKKVFHMVYLVSKAFAENGLHFSQELLSFL